MDFLDFSGLEAAAARHLLSAIGSGAASRLISELVSMGMWWCNGLVDANSDILNSGGFVNYK